MLPTLCKFSSAAEFGGGFKVVAAIGVVSVVNVISPVVYLKSSSVFLDWLLGKTLVFCPFPVDKIISSNSLASSDVTSSKMNFRIAGCC